MKKKIDIFKIRTEAEGQIAFDNWLIKAIPKWFQWIGWFLIIGALTYVDKKTDNWAIRLVRSVSYVGLLFYFQSYFYQFEFVVPFVNKYPKTARLFSLAISAILAFFIWYILKVSVAKIALPK
jgi:hypothetical protein